MTIFKKIRICIWSLMLITSTVLFSFAYSEGIMPLFYGSFIAMAILNAVIRYEFE